ncbi:MAG TPA: TIGR01777 family oxidoreductase [Terriglobia bacterium]|nr:TIGR01777 family oxidoreductase [Terriglobia bacterium]
MKVLITGSSGLIGSAAIAFLIGGGDEVVRLVRPSSPSEAGLTGDIAWDPKAGIIEESRLEGLDAVIHLAGENIGARRWTQAQKQRLVDSRITGTQLLSGSLARLMRPPKVLLSASAVGYYDDGREEWIDEGSSPGKGFLADLVRQWEAATTAAAQRGIRVVHMRFGMVLAPSGGVLARMLTPFRLGLGGRIGSGRQYQSWIAMDDVLGALRHLLEHAELSGAVNVTGPNPVTNSQFTKALGRAISRPTFAPLPAFAARLALGEMADELLLKGARVRPSKLLENGYSFLYPHLEGALRHLLRHG